DDQPLGDQDCPVLINSRVSAPRLSLGLEIRVAGFRRPRRHERRIGGMLTTRAIPNGNDESVLAVERNAISLPGGDRGISVSDVQRDLAQLSVERFVDLVAIEHVSDDAGENAHRGQKAKKPDQQTTSKRGHWLIS